MLPAGERSADGDLAVFDLPESPDVLSRGAHGHVPLFLDARVIQDKARSRAAAEQAVRAQRHLIHHSARVPWGGADGVVNVVIGEAIDAFLHAFEVFGPLLGGEQADGISANFRSAAIAAGTEQMAEGTQKGHEAGHHL